RRSPAPPPHEVVHRVVAVDRLAGVAPESFEHVRLERAALGVPVVDVGDLELAAAGRLELRQELPDLLVVEVDAGHDIGTGRIGGLLDDANDPPAVELGYAEMPEVLLLVDAREDDTRAPLLRLEPLDDRPERALEDVVGEEDAATLAADEPLRKPERLGDPAGLLLVGVQEPLDPVLVAVAEQPEELAGVRSP